MKAELVESPQAAARKIAKEQASDNESNLPLASEDDAASVAPVANGDEEVVDEADRDEDVGENGVDCGASDADSLHAPTLRLGVDTEPIEVNSDSQGSEPVWPQTGDREGLILKWLEEIEMFLKEAGNLNEHPMYKEYREHCDKALRLYGDHAFSTLASHEHFHLWVREQKSPRSQSYWPGERGRGLEPDASSKAPEAKRMSKQKQADAEESAVEGSKLTSFGQYDLEALNIPSEALPLENGTYKGKHSYTLNIQGAVVETLLKNRAFVVKKPIGGGPGSGYSVIYESTLDSGDWEKLDFFARRRRAVALDREYGGAEYDLLTEDSQAVRDGTILACRALILLLVASCRGCWWCLEQPISSCMEHLPCFQHLLRILEVRKYTMSMADYGGPTEKRTIIYSSSNAIDDLQHHKQPRRLRPKAMVERYVDSSGVSRVKGGADLRASQAYPQGFGRALAAVRTSHLKRHKRTARRFLEEASETENVMNERPRLNSAWVTGANLKPVLAFLSKCRSMPRFVLNTRLKVGSMGDPPTHRVRAKASGSSSDDKAGKLKLTEETKASSKTKKIVENEKNGKTAASKAEGKKEERKEPKSGDKAVKEDKKNDKKVQKEQKKSDKKVAKEEDMKREKKVEKEGKKSNKKVEKEEKKSNKNDALKSAKMNGKKDGEDDKSLKKPALDLKLGKRKTVEKEVTADEKLRQDVEKRMMEEKTRKKELERAAHKKTFKKEEERVIKKQKELEDKIKKKVQAKGGEKAHEKEEKDDGDGGKTKKRKEDEIKYVPVKRKMIEGVFTPPTKRPAASPSSCVREMVDGLASSRGDCDQSDDLSDLEEEAKDGASSDAQGSDGESDVGEDEKDEESSDMASEASEASEKEEEGEEDEAKSDDEESGEEDPDLDGEAMSEEEEADEAKKEEGDCEDEEEEDEEEEEEPTKETKALNEAVTSTKLRNSVTNKRDWDTFVRSKERFRMTDYFNSNKVELFNFWLDSEKSWDACALHVQRLHETKHQSKKGWVAIQGRELVTKYGEDRAKEIMNRRTEEGMYYKDDLYPDDANEVDDELMGKLIDQEVGVLRPGALPKVEAATVGGCSKLMTALTADAKVSNQKNPKKKEEKSEAAKPKTIQEELNLKASDMERLYKSSHKALKEKQEEKVLRGYLKEVDESDKHSSKLQAAANAFLKTTKPKKRKGTGGKKSKTEKKA
ncbi:unnamed protein product [Durusdinium trenchii]|uniref:Uncharacterized protein n=1 Tax=Durusdinium trenchii TaxID=1381693 RepID=A0ABP0PAT3_9DINO